MSKRNTESLRAFFNRCGRVGGFDEALTRVVIHAGSNPLPPILCKRGDLYYCNDSGEHEFNVESTAVYIVVDGKGAVDPAVARWLLRRARGEYSLPFMWTQAQIEECTANAGFDLGQYVASCAWGQVGNAFVGRRRSTWDGDDQWRLAIQGRVCCEVLTDRKNRVVKVGVFSAWMAEEHFLAERKNHRAREFCYKADLREAREMVRRWEAGENVEFTFVNGQKAGVIEWTDAVGLPKRVSAWGAGLGAGAAVGAPEWASSESLRKWYKEMELDSAVQLAGLWYAPTRECKKVRIAGQWFGTERLYQVGDQIEGVGEVVAIAR